jgi:dihydropteroate synthase
MRDEIRAKRDAFFAAIGNIPLVMGILNLTPDSFSDGGLHQSPGAAFARARQMVEEGCAIVDIGAESTRPGNTPVNEQDEIDRLLPVLERIIDGVDAPVSIDTTKAKVAMIACRLGVVLVNDVWGLQKDPAIADVAAEFEAGVVITHNREEKDPAADIISDMRVFFDRSLGIAERAGVPRARTILDPGIGFAKTAQQNLRAFGEVGKLAADYGLPVLIGASRKRFLGSLTGDGSEGRLVGSIAVNLAAAAAGAAIFRVHDVAENVTALKLFAQLRAAAG